MVKYKIFVSGGTVKDEQMFYSRSRSCKKHLQDNNAMYCDIFNMSDRQISSAWVDRDGKVRVRLYKDEEE